MNKDGPDLITYRKSSKITVMFVYRAKVKGLLGIMKSSKNETIYITLEAGEPPLTHAVKLVLIIINYRTADITNTIQAQMKYRKTQNTANITSQHNKFPC